MDRMQLYAKTSRCSQNHAASLSHNSKRLSFLTGIKNNPSSPPRFQTRCYFLSKIQCGISAHCHHRIHLRRTSSFHYDHDTISESASSINHEVRYALGRSCHTPAFVSQLRSMKARLLVLASMVVCFHRTPQPCGEKLQTQFAHYLIPSSFLTSAPVEGEEGRRLRKTLSGLQAWSKACSKLAVLYFGFQLACLLMTERGGSCPDGMR